MGGYILFNHPPSRRKVSHTILPPQTELWAECVGAHEFTISQSIKQAQFFCFVIIKCYSGSTKFCPGGEVVTLRSAKPTCAGSIPAQDSRISSKSLFACVTRPTPGGGICRHGNMGCFRAGTDKSRLPIPSLGRPARVVESVDTRDLKSLAF